MRSGAADVAAFLVDLRLDQFADGLAGTLGVASLSGSRLTRAEAGARSTFTIVDAAGLEYTFGGAPSEVDEWMRAMLKACLSLRALNISGCPMLTDATLHGVSWRCPELQTLNVSAVARIPD